MKTALIITTYNRPHYFARCIESLKKLTRKADHYIFIDDNSTNKTTKDYVYATLIFAKDYFNDKVSVEVKEKRKGIKDSLLLGFNEAFSKGADLAINLDSDAIVKPNFITRLVDLKKRFPSRIVSGFNCDNPKNPVLFDGKDYVERRHCNGINMCIDIEDYKGVIKPALERKQGNWDYDSTHNLNFIITKPSVVQHLAPNDSTMGHVGGDVACDFYGE